MGGLEALQQLKSLKWAVPVSTGGRSRDNGGATVLCGTSKQQVWDCETFRECEWCPTRVCALASL